MLLDIFKDPEVLKEHLANGSDSVDDDEGTDIDVGSQDDKSSDESSDEDKKKKPTDKESGAKKSTEKKDKAEKKKGSTPKAFLTSPSDSDSDLDKSGGDLTQTPKKQATLLNPFFLLRVRNKIVEKAKAVVQDVKQLVIGDKNEDKSVDQNRTDAVKVA